MKFNWKELVTEIVVLLIAWEITDYFTANVWKSDAYLPEFLTLLVSYILLFLIVELCKSVVRTVKEKRTDPKPVTPEEIRGRLTEEQQAEITALVEKGEKVKAAKLVRDITGADLKDCKDYAEGLGQEPRK